MKAKIKFFLSHYDGDIPHTKPFWCVYAQSSKGKTIDTTGSVDDMVRELAKDYVPAGKSGTLKLEFEKTNVIENPEISFTVSADNNTRYFLNGYTITHNGNSTTANVCKEWFHKIFGETKIGDVWTLTKVTWEPKV